MGNYCNSMCPTSIYCIFRGLMHANRKVVSSSLGPAGIGGGGVDVQRSLLSSFNTTTEVA